MTSPFSLLPHWFQRRYHPPQSGFSTMFRFLTRAALALLVLAGSLHAQTQRAAFTATCAALTCKVDASASTTPTTIAGYIWSWGDARIDTTRTPIASHTYAAPGSKSVRLTLLRTLPSNTVAKAVTLTAAPPPPTATPPAIPPSVIVPAPSVVTLPRTLLNTTAPAAPAAGGKVISVANGGNLQNAINSALPGDVIELANGATFVGNFTLTNKGPSTEWITIRPANSAQLPAEGTRMRPSTAKALALPIVLSGQNGAFVTATGAHHWRIIGLELTPDTKLPQVWALVALDASAKTLAELPHSIILDRLYVHGNPTQALRRCILLNTGAAAVLDSWVSDCHEAGSDSQAIAAWTAAGPLKIVNNYLEGAGENVMFGGADPSVPNLTPSDIEFRRNHVAKLIAWKGSTWTIKTLFESKHAAFLLVEGNVFEGNWNAAWPGTAIALKSVNQSGSCSWCVTHDVTVRLNVIRNVGSGFNVAGSPDNANPTVHAHRIAITDNLLTALNVAPYNGDGRSFMIGGDPNDLTIAHNTMPAATSAALVFAPFGGPRAQRMVVRDNILGGGNYGVIGDNYSGSTAIAFYMPGGTLTGNLLIGAGGGLAGNSVAATLGAVGFADLITYQLSAGSPFAKKATDGRDPGADIPAVLAATAGVVIAP